VDGRSTREAARPLTWLIATALWRAGICTEMQAKAFARELAGELRKNRDRRRALRIFGRG